MRYHLHKLRRACSSNTQSPLEESTEWKWEWGGVKNKSGEDLEGVEIWGQYLLKGKRSFLFLNQISIKQKFLNRVNFESRVKNMIISMFI